ncbi:ribosomal RNA small subunit methyltransferase F [Escherichia coli]|uniref:Ribosomal RNA small subunit methyltransferase F n=1 Tax=Escherichia coli TaxID=562 RepID=A0A376UAD7_ECOLX|nr:ribosomal RNA small subunit methyltransferase F [Escherichia coli]
MHVFPQIYDCEGFFVARLRKTQAIPALPAPKYKVGNFPFSPVKDREAGTNSSGGCKCWLKLGWKPATLATRQRTVVVPGGH